MTRAEQKQMERFVIEKFRQQYPNFPKEEIEDAESPDFVIGETGIELMEFQRGVTLRQLEESCNVVCNMVKTLLDQLLHIPQYYLAVHWKSEIDPILKKNYRALAASIVAAFSTIPQPCFDDFELDYEVLKQFGLDNHINLIQAFYTPNEDVQCYPAHGGWLEISYSQLNDHIAKKEAKVAVYRQAVRSIWLLIYSGTDNLASFGVLMPWAERLQPNTMFDKVFYFDVSTNRINELK